MSDDDFLSRWSRRKRAVAEEASPSDEAARPAPAISEPATAEEEEALLVELKLPSPESMKPGDDFSAFMADGVPEFLRKRALRVLWRSNPVLANLDGLNDYDDDFTSPELTQKVLATAYQVGRGIVSQVTQDETEDAPIEVADTAEAESPEPEQVDEIHTETVAFRDTTAHSDAPSASVKPRRMRFGQKTD